MVELRWIRRCDADGVLQEPVLQYRQLQDQTNYAAAQNNALSRQWINDGNRHMVMGEWRDVPVEVEVAS